MKTNRLLSLAIILLYSSALIAMVQNVSAQTVVPGVSKGETFDYSYSLIWTSTDPSAAPPQDLVEYNNTQQIQFRITDVSGTILAVDFLRHFKNGTQTVQSGTINIQNGVATAPYGFLIIGSNLAKDQRVYPTGGYQTITDTVMRSYSSGQRETNVISGTDTSQSTTIYFDKIKGIAVDYAYTIYETSDGYNIASTEKMVNTNSDVWATSTSSTQTTNTPTQTSGGTTSPIDTSSPTPQSSIAAATSKPTNSGTHTVPVTLAPITETAIDLSNILVGAVVAVIILVGLAVLLTAFRKRKKPKEDSASAENDFDISGFDLK